MNRVVCREGFKYSPRFCSQLDALHWTLLELETLFFFAYISFCYWAVARWLGLILSQTGPGLQSRESTRSRLDFVEQPPSTPADTLLPTIHKTPSGQRDNYEFLRGGELRSGRVWI